MIDIELAITKKKSLNSSKNIYVYALNEQVLLFARRCEYTVLTLDKNIFNKCINEKINVLLAPKGALKFKKFLKNLQISLVVLMGDNYHGRSNYIARNYPSAFIQGGSWNTHEFFRSRALKKENTIYMHIYKLLSLTVKLFGQDKVIYDLSIKAIFSAIKEKIIWGLRNESYFHGSFCDLLFLQSDYEKKIYINNHFPSSKIFITGSPSADFFVSESLNSKKVFSFEKAECDLLFFSQPFVLFPEYKEDYLRELEQVVEKCCEMNLKMTIKLHPRDDVSFYKKFQSKNCNLVVNEKNNNNAQNLSLISNSKIIMGKGSMTLLNSMLMGKPVIFLDIMESELVHYKYYINLKLLLKNINEFEEMYLSLLHIETREHIISQQNLLLDIQGFYDGKSWRRIKEQIDVFLFN